MKRRTTALETEMTKVSSRVEEHLKLSSFAEAQSEKGIPFYTKGHNDHCIKALLYQNHTIDSMSVPIQK